MPVPIVTFISTDEYVDDDDEEEEEYDNLQDLKGKDALNRKELDLLSNTHGGLPLLILVLNLDA